MLAFIRSRQPVAPSARVTLHAPRRARATRFSWLHVIRVGAVTAVYSSHLVRRTDEAGAASAAFPCSRVLNVVSRTLSVCTRSSATGLLCLSPVFCLACSFCTDDFGGALPFWGPVLRMRGSLC